MNRANHYKRRIFAQLTVILCFILNVLIPCRVYGQDLSLVPALGHSKQVNSAALSPDGRRVVTGSADNRAKVWDIVTGRELFTLEDHTKSVRSAIYTPDGSQIVTISEDKTTKIWNALTGELVTTIHEDFGVLEECSFSKDGERIVIVSENGTVCIWSVLTWELTKRISQVGRYPVSASYLKGGSQILILTDDGHYEIWDDNSKKLLSRIPFESSPDYCYPSPNGKVLLTVSETQGASLVDIKTGKSQRSISSSREIISASYSSDGNRISLLLSDSTAVVLDGKTGLEILKLDGHNGSGIISAKFTRHGYNLLITSYDYTSSLIDVVSGNEVAIFRGAREWGISAIAFSPDGSQFLLAMTDGSAKLWSSRTGQLSWQISGHSDLITSASFAPDGRHIVTASIDHTAKVWSSDSGIGVGTLSGHKSWVMSASYSPDSTQILTTSWDGTARVWNANTGLEDFSLVGHNRWVLAGMFSPNGEKIVTSAIDGTAKIWNAISGDLIYTLLGHNDWVKGVIIPDEFRVVTSSLDGTAKLWDLNSGKELLTLTGHTDYVVAADFSPDGIQIVTTSGDGTAKIWNASTGRELKTLTIEGDTIYYALYSPDGKCIVTLLPNGRIAFFDVKNGQVLYELYIFRDGSAIFMSPDGRYDSSEGSDPINAHFVQKTPMGPEVVLFDQLKSNEFYVPGLVEKILSGNYEAGKYDLRSVGVPPEVKQSLIGEAIEFEVTNRGGGIGKVQILINGEVAKEYKPGEIVSNKPVQYTIPALPTGVPVDVIAWNASNTVSSTVPSKIAVKGDNETIAEEVDESPVEFHAILLGSEQYNFGGLRPLNYGGNDAVEVAKVLNALAKSSGIRPENIHLHVMSDEPLAKGELALSGISVQEPTRANWDKAAKEVENSKLTPNDILFVFFSGHGTAVGGDNPDYLYFLTSARTGSPNEYLQLDSRKIDTITGTDIKNLMLSALYGKRVVVVDTCGAESATENLVNTFKSEVDDIKKISAAMAQESRSTQLLFGCPADLVSYEDPRFGHGLLTYSLLFALKTMDSSDPENPTAIQADTWISATAKVAEINAQALGLRQEAMPISQSSFTIGRMSDDDRRAIVLPNEKKLITSISLLNDIDLTRSEWLIAALQARLIASSNSKSSSIVYIRSESSPIGFQLTGLVSESGLFVTVQLTLKEVGEQGRVIRLEPIKGDRANIINLIYEAVKAKLSEK